jgi:hypothetical protein
MAQPPMLEIRKDEATTSQGTVNVLPCRVHHTGSIEPSSAYWNPSVDESEKLSTDCIMMTDSNNLHRIAFRRN